MAVPECAQLFRKNQCQNFPDLLDSCNSATALRTRRSRRHTVTAPSAVHGSSCGGWRSSRPWTPGEGSNRQTRVLEVNAATSWHTGRVYVQERGTRHGPSALAARCKQSAHPILSWSRRRLTFMPSFERLMCRLRDVLFFVGKVCHHSMGYVVAFLFLDIGT